MKEESHILGKVDVNLIKSLYLTNEPVTEKIKLIKTDIETYRHGNKPFDEVIEELADEMGYQTRIIDSIQKRDVDETLNLLKKVDEILMGFSNLNRVGYSDLELKTRITNFFDGRTDQIYIYMSDGGHGRLIVDYDGLPENYGISVKTGSQTTPGPAYLWEMIK